MKDHPLPLSCPAANVSLSWWLNKTMLCTRTCFVLFTHMKLMILWPLTRIPLHACAQHEYRVTLKMSPHAQGTEVLLSWLNEIMLVYMQHDVSFCLRTSNWWYLWDVNLFTHAHNKNMSYLGNDPTFLRDRGFSLKTTALKMLHVFMHFLCVFMYLS